MKIQLTAAVLALSLGLLAGCGDDSSEPTAADPNTDGTTPSAESTPGDATSTPGDTETDDDTGEGSGEEVTVPVYFVGETPMGPRLYREFHAVPGADPLTEAAQLLAEGVPDDPDYRSLLEGLTVDSVEQGADSITVNVSGALSTDLSARQSDLAVQSLVYTLQGVAQERLPVVVAGDAPTLVGATPVEAQDELDVLALVNVTTPETGEAVSGTFTAEGVASSFEATVPWQVRDASGETVLDGFATAEGWMDGLYPWETDVDVSSLAPGEYTFAALTDDPSGGEGPGPFEDTKTFTVG